MNLLENIKMVFHKICSILKFITKKFFKLLLILMMIIFLLIMIGKLLNYYNAFMGEKFNREKWYEAGKLTPDGNIYYRERCKMCHNLQLKHLYQGMYMKEVEELLGRRYIFHYCIGNKIKCTSYFIGACYYGSNASLTFNTCYDRKERLIGYGVEYDSCNTIGSYDIDSKEKSCFRDNPDGTSTALYGDGCKFDPW